MENDALEFATKAHGPQKRKYSDEMYIEHPKRVADLLRNVPHTEEMICAAYLHDVVEDTPVGIKEIEEKFGAKVAALVEELTDEYVKERYPQFNRRRRKEREVRRLAEISSEGKTIKLADIIDNTPDIVRNDPAFGRKYVKEMEAMVAVMDGGDQMLLERARKEIQKGKQELKLSSH